MSEPSPLFIDALHEELQSVEWSRELTIDDDEGDYEAAERLAYLRVLKGNS